MKKLLSFKRISVDIYVKLTALQQEDKLHDNRKMLETLSKQNVVDEENFFLSEEDRNMLEDGKGFETADMDEYG